MALPKVRQNLELSLTLGLELPLTVQRGLKLPLTVRQGLKLALTVRQGLAKLVPLANHPTDARNHPSNSPSQLAKKTGHMIS